MGRCGAAPAGTDFAADLPLWSPESFREHRFDLYTAPRIVAMAMKHRPGFYPGDTNPDGTPKWSYSNTGYILLGMIIDRVTGHRWHHEIRDRIIKPLGLTGTSIPVHHATLPRPYTRGYDRFGDVDAELTDVTVLNPSATGSSGAMVSTTADNIQFFQALLSGRLLSPRLLAQMQRTVPTKARVTAWGSSGTRCGAGRPDTGDTAATSSAT